VSDTEKFYETQMQAAKDALDRGDREAAVRAIDHACSESTGSGDQAVVNGLNGLNSAAKRMWGKKD
jgi:hypothetical protein